MTIARRSVTKGGQLGDSGGDSEFIMEGDSQSPIRKASAGPWFLWLAIFIASEGNLMDLLHGFENPLEARCGATRIV